MAMARGWMACAVVALAAGCNALTGADDLTADRCAGDACASTDTSGTNPDEPESKKPPPKPPSPGTSEGGGGGSSEDGGGSSTQTTFGVVCGTTTCSGATPKCCARPNGPASCIAADGTCGEGFVFACSGGGAGCANGLACCFISDQGIPFAECRAASACVLPSAIVCTSDEDCPTKKCAGMISGFAAYRVCSPY